MRACHIQYVLLLSLLGFFPRSGTLTCHKGIMMKLGSGFSKTAVEWKSFESKKGEPKEICQETLLLIDVGNKSLLLGSKGSSNPGEKKTKNIQLFSRGPGIVAASYVHFCDTELCNNANSTSVLLDPLSLADSPELGTTQCPVCLQFQGFCSHNSNFVFCPKGTHCYTSDLTLQGGELNTTFSIDGCLLSPDKFLLKKQTSIGIFSAVELSVLQNVDSLSHILIPSTLLTWMLGLRPLLSPSFTEICPLS
ncbi:CD177 antigen-like isoform X1 [Mastomys coucha]|uniref:CD177 antigen-like isoform X1 n=1 Tax=Mastomys coucha TaxID=35658 RepID=UPI00126210CA|nr:CD177 antigen-like isoform X1 [Mastomys coucha]XP_031241538.1 CD177 antigen-like isoform X1 [Mastomys coucha]XP_031241539.1 CD177 antigen-like isoform X1 [Mastomys coucha]XP_031241540.1 CD177 antigen-like isoform X1 [Mastomys coucha]